MTDNTDDARRIRWLMLILAVSTVALFAPTWRQQMLYWDDDVNVLQNPLVTQPGLAGLKTIFTSIFSTDYYPITYISLALDHALWHGRFAGYHVTQTMLHALNAALVLALVWRWTKNVPVAVVVAVGFAWHPIQVESVSWIAERKNILGTCFILLAWLAYLRSETEPRWRLVALVLFLLGALSHALVIILPLLLWLYEFAVHRASWMNAFRRTWLFLVPAGFAAVMRVLGHHNSRQLDPNFPSRMSTLLSMTKVLGEYLNTIFHPVSLNNSYFERFVHDPWTPGVWITVVWLAAWLVAIWLGREHRRWIAFGLGWFLISLLPVLQLVPHPTVRADRYLYSAILGPLLTVALLLSRRPVLLKTAGVLAALSLAGLTLARIPDWQNSRTLWTDSVAKDPESPMAHYSLAGCLIGDHDLSGAEKQARLAIELKPGFAAAHERLSSLLLVEGHVEEAREHAERALALDPHLYEARHNLALINSLPPRSPK
jgi:hypothetical protein